MPPHPPPALPRVLAGMFLAFPLTPRQGFALFKVHFPAAAPPWLPCPAACGWPGWAVCAGCGPSLARQGLPRTAGPWHPHPGHCCPLPALPVAPVSFPQLPLHYAEKAVEIRSVLLSRGHLEIKPSDLGFPGLTSFLPDRLRGPGCHGTLWLVMQRSLFSGRQPVFLQYFKANYPVSPLTFVLFCCVFWVFSGGDPAAREKKNAREQLLWVQTWWSPPKAIQSRGVSSQGPFSHGSWPP